MIIFILVLNIGCEDEQQDTIPPSVNITTPFVGTVHEIVTISCMASDDSGIDKLELWVDGVYTSIYDDTEPYQLNWNTTIYEDGSAHVIVVRAYDINGNTSDTPAYTLIVDNSGSYPSAVILNPVVYDNISGSFVVTWSASIDNDFVSYTLLEGMSDDINNMETIHTANMVDDTTFTILGISEGEIRYYQVLVHDIYGYNTGSNVSQGISAIIWASVYDYMDNSDWGNSIIEVDDGYWITGVSDQQMRLFKIDLLGNIISDQIISNGYANEIIRLEDGSLFLIGGAGAWNSSVQVIYKLDDSGNIIEGTDIESQYASAWAYGAVVGPSSSPMLYVYGEMDGSAVIHSVSQSLGSSQELVYTDQQMHRVKDMIKIDDGYVIASSNNEQTKIVKTDFDFNLTAQQTLDGYSRSINVTSDGNILLAMQTGDPEHQLIKLNLATGVIYWEISADGIYNGFEVDDSYYAVGHHNGASLFMKLDISGNIISSSSFGSGVISDFSVTSDGGLVLTGTTSYWNDELSDTPVYKTDLNGTVNSRFNHRIVQGNSIIIPDMNNPDLNVRPF